nr:Hpt domain-containing protein [Pseudomonas sp. RIT-PI-S]
MGEDYPLLVDTYLRDSEQRLAKLVEITSAPELREAAHSFKGSSSNMGATPLAELCGQLEHLELDAPSAVAATLVQQIASEFACVRSCFLAERQR